MKIFEFFKAIFFLMLILLFARPVYMSIKKMFYSTIENRDYVGVIIIKDTISNGTKYSRHIKEFFEDNSIKAIVLKIDSPGGFAGSTQAIFEEIKYHKKKNNKPVITFIENICASGGYYIAATSDHIIATPSAYIGSIGAYMAYPELKDFINYYNINYKIVQAGKYKTIGNPFANSATEDQNKLLQQLTDDTYEQFISDVASSRPKLDLAKSKDWADGKIFTGRQALKLGLVDSLGGFSNLIDIVKKEAAIENEIEWVKVPKKHSGIASYFDTDDETSDGSFVNSNYSNSSINNIASSIIEQLEKKYLDTKTALKF